MCRAKTIQSRTRDCFAAERGDSEQQMFPRPTIKDVAAAARVSPTTVSHVLNDKGRISPETRARIKRTVERLGYQPNRLAQGLRSGRAGVKALWLPLEPDTGAEALALDYYMRLASATASALFTHGDFVMLMPPAVPDRAVVQIAIDGAIVVDPSENDRRIEVLDRLNVPTVTVERNPIDPDDPWCVASDIAHNMECLLDHLSTAGAQRIGALIPKAMGAWSGEARSAYLSWSEFHGVAPIIRTVQLRPAFDRARHAASSLLRSRKPPDSLIIGAERFVPGVMQAIRDLGRAVPNDLFVAVTVDGNYARAADPGLTAIDLQPELQAALAVDLLVSRLEGVTSPGPRTVPGLLRPRESSASRTSSADPGKGLDDLLASGYRANTIWHPARPIVSEPPAGRSVVDSST